MFRVTRLQTISSTNEYIKNALERGEPEGLVCRAAEQTGGYGRQGRIWSSPRGGSYQSLLVRPQVQLAILPTLALVTALAVRSAVVETAGLDASIVQVKWPNDIVCAAGKLAGISCERHAGGVCVGIGVNVARPVDAEPVGGKYEAAYLGELADMAHIAPSSQEAVEMVGDAVLEAFRVYYGRWLDEGFAGFAAEFDCVSSLYGSQVEIVDLNGTMVASGLAGTVDAQGRLLVGGTYVSSGEAHIR